MLNKSEKDEYHMISVISGILKMNKKSEAHRYGEQMDGYQRWGGGKGGRNEWTAFVFSLNTLSFKKEDQIERTHIYCIQNLLQSYSNQDSVVLA